MATPAQITANRANAQRSTGPRSVEGKSVSRLNALKHGIDAATAVIPGESLAEYITLRDEYYGRFQPQSPDERYHVQTMIDCDWQKRRLHHVEMELCRAVADDPSGQSLAAAMIAGTPAAKLIARTQRQLAAQERAWYRAYTELRLQREREIEGDQPYYMPCQSPDEEAAESEQLASFPQEPEPEDETTEETPELYAMAQITEPDSNASIGAPQAASPSAS